VTKMIRDIHVRRAVSLEQLRRLEERLAETVGAQGYAPFIRVALRIREFEWKAELGILEEIERELAHDEKTDSVNDRATDSSDEVCDHGREDRDPQQRARKAGRRGSALT